MKKPKKPRYYYKDLLAGLLIQPTKDTELWREGVRVAEVDAVLPRSETRPIVVRHPKHDNELRWLRVNQIERIISPPKTLQTREFEKFISNTEDLP